MMIVMSLFMTVSLLGGVYRLPCGHMSMRLQ
jgi:hypothetical protein